MGDIENGKSIKVINICLPLNWYLVITQAAHTPNMTFKGTATPTAISVNLNAAKVSDSVITCQKAVIPLASPCANTTKSGKNNRIKNNNIANSINNNCTLVSACFLSVIGFVGNIGINLPIISYFY